MVPSDAGLREEKTCQCVSELVEIDKWIALEERKITFHGLF
jgi:hypothetical protein